MLKCILSGIGYWVSRETLISCVSNQSLYVLLLIMNLNEFFDIFFCKIELLISKYRLYSQNDRHYIFFLNVALIVHRTSGNFWITTNSHVTWRRCPASCSMHWGNKKREAEASCIWQQAERTHRCIKGKTLQLRWAGQKEELGYSLKNACIAFFSLLTSDCSILNFSNLTFKVYI